jgi:hypothetical protein
MEAIIQMRHLHYCLYRKTMGSLTLRLDDACLHALLICVAYMCCQCCQLPHISKGSLTLRLDDAQDLLACRFIV